MDPTSTPTNLPEDSAVRVRDRIATLQDLIDKGHRTLNDLELELEQPGLSSDMRVGTIQSMEDKRKKIAKWENELQNQQKILHTEVRPEEVRKKFFKIGPFEFGNYEMIIGGFIAAALVIGGLLVRNEIALPPVINGEPTSRVEPTFADTQAPTEIPLIAAPTTSATATPTHTVQPVTQTPTLTSTPPTELVSPTTTSAQPVSTGNLAPNPSFENGTNFPTWWTFQIRSDATFKWDETLAYDGVRSIMITGHSPSTGRGWPAWETTNRIPIDPVRMYEFSVRYYTPDKALLWMEIQFWDSKGKWLGGISTGTSFVLPAPKQWHRRTLILNPGSLSSIYPDIAEVKLELKLSLNYDVVGLPEGTVTTIYFDDVSFSPLE